MRESGCSSDSKISITTLHFFLKNYNVYGALILGIVALYTLLSISLVTCCKSYSSLHTGAPFFVWNVVASIISMYFMFKPMQYYPKSLNNEAESNPASLAMNGDIQCQVDSIDENWETAIEYCVYASFVIFFGGWILGIFRCWINRRVIASGIRRTHKIKSIFINFEKVELLIAAILATTFFVVILVSSILMIHKRLKEQRWGEDCMDIVVLILVDVLAVMAMIDIHFFEFCKNTRRHFFGKSRRLQRRDDFLVHFGSFHEVGPNVQENKATPVPLVTAKEEQKVDK